MKTCSDCKQKFPLDIYGKDNSKKDKLSIYCKTCVALRNKKFYMDHPGYVREYYLTHKMRIQARIEEWCYANSDKCREYSRRYFNANKDKINAQRRNRTALKRQITAQGQS